MLAARHPPACESLPAPVMTQTSWVGRRPLMTPRHSAMPTSENTANELTADLSFLSQHTPTSILSRRCINVAVKSLDTLSVKNVTNKQESRVLAVSGEPRGAAVNFETRPISQRGIGQAQCLFEHCILFS